MDNKSTTKRMIGAVVLVLIAALLLAWLLKGKNKSVQEQQELIADQTQEAAPILGFPGVNEDDKDADGQNVAQNGSDGAATEDGSYVIGAAEQATDNAQQQAQNALAAGGAAASAAGQAAADGATQAAGAVTGAAAGAANQAEQQVANATGFQVRDPQSQDGGAEQRPIVEDGEVKAGTGSMGGSEVATGTQAQDQSGSDSTQTAAASTGGAAAQSSGDASGSDSAAQQTASAGSGSSGDNSGAARLTAKAANPKLVNEKPVPAPRTQSASAGNRSGSSSSRSASGRSASANSSRSGAAAGGKGYAIQVLAASKLSTAESLKKDIERDGYPVFVVRAKVNGKTYYRVRVGTYPARGDASAVQAKLKSRYTKNQYVQNSFVTKN